MEILEFTVKDSHYAINVIKVKEILEVESFSKVPKSDPAVLGMALIRGEVIPLIDMSVVLEDEFKDRSQKFKILLCEFNHLKVGFVVDQVLGIHRIGWDAIKKPTYVNDVNSSLVIGNITFNERILMLLDFEKIVTDISPSTGINAERIGQIAPKDRSKVKLVLSDDSTLIRQLLRDVLTEAGFVNMRFFDDGKQALDHLSNLASQKGESFMDDVDILITDIEMPQMDGHTLTRKVKEDPILRKLPVIIFSSLITDDLKHKGDSVQADAQMSKPEVGKLVELIDGFVRHKYR
ncbi:chemotaxis protein CheV [Andreesenia angusta]|uniref:Chemotaxis protein CheV n=2 Tax=Andreesenia angusta TaxID=39480 RepID=A0A1S1V9P6_9FIRM|nr:chemotaxis protein CheV [Andreesenia angusta]